MTASAKATQQFGDPRAAGHVLAHQTLFSSPASIYVMDFQWPPSYNKLAGVMLGVRQRSQCRLCLWRRTMWHGQERPEPALTNGPSGAARELGALSIAAGGQAYPARC